MKTIKPLVLALSSLLIFNTVHASDDQDIVSGEVVSASADTSAISSIERGGRLEVKLSLDEYAQRVNEATWSEGATRNTAMTIKLQTLLDWNHASPGAIDGGWGPNSQKALANFQKIKGLKPTGKMDQATWDALTQNIDSGQPVLVSYTITEEDAKGPYHKLPVSVEARSKLKALGYESIEEMLSERFHMDMRYLTKLNPGKKFVAGETITVINTGSPLKGKVTRVVANRKDNILYAYDGNKLVAAYPTTVGGPAKSTPAGKFTVINKVKMPTYKATVAGRDGEDQKVYFLPPGPNSPVGVAWIGLNKPSYGIHGSQVPEKISRQTSHGCIRLTNWDVLELLAVIEDGATVEIL